MGSSSPTTTDLLIEYEDLALTGRAPEPAIFCAGHPKHPSLLGRIEELNALRHQLKRLGQCAALRAEKPPSIPGFTIQKMIGRGGMACVYLAEQPSPRRFCSLKVLHSAAPTAIARFRREADFAARLDHPGIARVYATGVANDRPYLASEYVHGFSLRALLQAADLVSPEDPSTWLSAAIRRLREDPDTPAVPRAVAPVAVVLDLAIQVAHALAHAHARGVIHRDVKPSNVVVALDGKAKLIDFGIAVALDAADERLTCTGAFVGSFGYAAPEQLQGDQQALGPWSDTYALGAMLFEMLTQQTPFPCATFADRLMQAEEPPPHGPRHFNAQVPPALDRLVLRALRPRRNERFVDGDAMVQALEEMPHQALGLALLPSSRFWDLLPRSRLHYLALLWLGTTVLLGGLYLEERADREAERWAIESSRLASAHAILDWVLQSKRNTLEQCVLYNRRLDPSRFRPRLLVLLTIESERVAYSDTLERSPAMLSDIQACLLKRLGELHLPGVGMEGPVQLRVQLYVDLQNFRTSP